MNHGRVPKCTANIIHGIARAEAYARYSSLVTSFKSQLGDSQDIGIEALLTGAYEHFDKFIAIEARYQVAKMNDRNVVLAL